MDGFASIFKRDSIPNSTSECMVLSKSLSLIFLIYNSNNEIVLATAVENRETRANSVS